jgi:hypothetical protein
LPAGEFDRHFADLLPILDIIYHFFKQITVNQSKCQNAKSPMFTVRPQANAQPKKCRHLEKSGGAIASNSGTPPLGAEGT